MIYSNAEKVLIYIKQQMLAEQITIKDLAIRMNKSQSATSQLLRQKNISLETLNEICKAINCQLEINIVPNTGDA